ncbi:MAG: VCBS repeat-containing protein [Planctomycetota bacterium]
MGDLNGDAYADIVCINRSSNTITISYGNSTGATAPVSLPAGLYPDALVLVDLNADGYDDIVCGNRDDDTLTISMGSSTGHDTTPDTVPCGKDPSSGACGDINGDGYPDAVITNQYTDDATILFGCATGYLPPEFIPVGDNPQQVACGDMDGDGRDDIICANRNDDSMTISYGTPIAFNTRGLAFTVNPAAPVTVAAPGGFTIGFPAGCFPAPVSGALRIGPPIYLSRARAPEPRTKRRGPYRRHGM